MKERILIGGRTFFETQAKSLMDAYKQTLKKFFMITEFVDGKLQHKLMDKHPSYSQFQYWYYEMRNFEEGLIRRIGERNFLLNARPLKGRATDIAYGPGSVYQIDATMGDVYLVSPFDRTKIIGKPIVMFALYIMFSWWIRVFHRLEDYIIQR